jgi:type IV pilus assembly protein PilE
MRQALVSTAAPRPQQRLARGFTLIEVMIVVAIVAILAAVAIPSYRDYILRGQLVDATTLLSAGRANMERYFQDNRTYADVGSITPATCATSTTNFTLSCSGRNGTGYTLIAQGSGPVAAFTYTVDATGLQKTTGVPSGWNTSNTCWIMKKGQSC